MKDTQPQIVDIPMKDESGLTVVKAGEYAPVLRDGLVYITVEGKNPEELVGLDAKRLAWGERFMHGMGSAGIETYQAPFPKPAVGKAKADGRYFVTFRLTPGL